MRTKRGGGGSEPTHPKPGVIVAAANVVGVDVSKALELAGYEPATYSPSSSAPLTRSERAVAQRLSMLSPEQLNAVGSVVDALLAGLGLPAEDDSAAEPDAEVGQPQFLAADTAPPSESGPRSRGRLGHPAPGRRRGVMSHESGHDEEGRNPGMPEPRPAESRM